MQSALTPAEDAVADGAKYDPAVHPRQAEIMCEKGAVDRELAELWNISMPTFYRWRLEYPELAMALKCGKEAADDRVERSLYNRAVGYDYDSVKIITVSVGNNGGSEVQEIPYVEHVPPDVKAATRWLEARRPKVWRKTIGVGAAPEEMDDPDLANLSPEERAEVRKGLQILAGKRGGGAGPSDG